MLSEGMEAAAPINRQAIPLEPTPPEVSARLCGPRKKAFTNRVCLPSHMPKPEAESANAAPPQQQRQMPKLVVFDLDYTLWPFWCDTHVSPPLRPSFTGDAVVDSNGDEFSFYREVPSIFREIKADPAVELCAASRTSEPRIAQNILSMLRIDDEPSSTYFAFTAWGTGTKVRHFQELHLHTGIAYEDMIFFDDENRNRDVERQLGVVFIEVRNGLSLHKYHEGIREWQRRRAPHEPIEP